jgi:hypothetical protein
MKHIKMNSWTCIVVIPFIMSHVWGSMTNNNGFWIGWMALLLQLQPIITAHKQWLCMTCSIPYWTTSVFSSVTNDEQRIPSSASVGSWLTLNFWIILQLNYDWINLSLSLMLQPTVSRPVYLGAKHPSGAYDQIFITCVTVTVLFLWGALSDKRSGLSFVYAAGPCQRSLSRVRVPWDSRPYFTVSHLRLPFSSPPMTRRVTVEVFGPASTRVVTTWINLLCTPTFIV